MAPSSPDQTPWTALELLERVEKISADLDPSSKLGSLDPFTRFALACKVLALRPIAADVGLGDLTIDSVNYLFGTPDALPDMAAVELDGTLKSARVVLRAPDPGDVEVIFATVNNPDVAWRLPSRGKYVGPEDLLDNLINGSAQMVVASERSSGRPVTVLGLSTISEANGVGELSFFSLRNNSDPDGALSTEALACFVSHCFRTLGLRKLTAGIPDSNYSQFSALEGFVFEREGLLRQQVACGTGYEDLHLVAVWPREWFKLEPVLHLALSNWQVD